MNEHNGLINRAAARKLILQAVRELRPHWQCRRVSKRALDALEACLRAKIKGQVEGHPTVGHTFDP